MLGPVGGHGAAGPTATGPALASRGAISQSPWKKAPSSMRSFGETRVACTREPASSSIRCRPCTRPLTVPRMETTPQSISASTWPDSPTISVLSETTRPFSRPSMRKVSRKRSSPWNSVPSSMKPFRSSATRPLIFSMAPPWPNR